MLGQAVNDALAPNGDLELGTNVASDFPVQPNEFGIDGLIGALARLLDEADNLGESGFDRLGAGRGDCASGWEGGSTGSHDDERTKRSTRSRLETPAGAARGLAALPWPLALSLCKTWRGSVAIARIGYGGRMTHLRELAAALTDVQAAEELNEARLALFRRLPSRTG